MKPNLRVGGIYVVVDDESEISVAIITVYSRREINLINKLRANPQIFIYEKVPVEPPVIDDW